MMLLLNQTSDSSDDYAYLPDELLEDILDGTNEVADGVKASYDWLLQRREAMRNTLLAQGNILAVADLEPVPSPSVAAVDGGLAIEKSIGADTILVAAVGVEGLVREDQRRWSGVQYTHWQKVVPHSSDASRFAFGIMAALELQIAAQAPHDVVIVDGLHLNPIIALNTMLSLKEVDLTPLMADVLRKYEVLDSLSIFLQRPSLTAMVKYDSSRELSQAWFGDEVRLDDRTLMTILLKPGEYSRPTSIALTPERKGQIEDLHIIIGDRDFPERAALNQEFKNTLQHAKQLYVTYYRPWEWAPAYRIELKRQAVNSTNRIAVILQAVREQVVTSEVREPYPQFLADQMAKSVSAGLQALRSAVMFELADSGADTLLRMLAQSYRTE
jgi:hypothetical protein